MNKISKFWAREAMSDSAKVLSVKMPVGVEPCARFTACTMGVMNVFMAIAGSSGVESLGLGGKHRSKRSIGKPEFVSLFLAYEFSKSEIYILLHFVRDTDGLPLSLPEKREHISLPTYHLALTLLAESLYDLRLPFMISESLTFIDPLVVQQTIDTLISQKKEESIEFSQFLKETLTRFQKTRFQENLSQNGNF